MYTMPRQKTNIEKTKLFSISCKGLCKNSCKLRAVIRYREKQSLGKWKTIGKATLNSELSESEASLEIYVRFWDDNKRMQSNEDPLPCEQSLSKASPLLGTKHARERFWLSFISYNGATNWLIFKTSSLNVSSSQYIIKKLETYRKFRRCSLFRAMGS